MQADAHEGIGWQAHSMLGQPGSCHHRIVRFSGNEEFQGLCTHGHVVNNFGKHGASMKLWACIDMMKHFECSLSWVSWPSN